MEKINRVVYLAIVWITFSCEPLVTTFNDVEKAILYEAKIFIDTTEPEFTGSGAYITSYQTSESISSIITNHIYAIDDIDGAKKIGFQSEDWLFLIFFRTCR